MKICISAGETSGDEHAAGLVRALKLLLPQAEFSGMGGSKLRAEGVNTVVDCEKSASVMGFGDVLKSLSKIYRTLSDLKLHLSKTKPQLLILVDYPDFNLKLAKFAAQNNIPVFYFIPPTIWAWRESRVNLIKSYVRRVALIFPFEKKFYEKHSYLEAYYVGHPFSDSLQRTPPAGSRENWFRRHKLDPSKPLVALLPGSRKGEIERLLQLTLDSAKLLRASHPEVQFVIGIAPNLNSDDFVSLLAETNWISFVQGETENLLRFASAGLLKSGTSNLQAAFLGLPFVMFYKASLFTQAIAKLMIRVGQYSPVNVIRNNTVVELTQKEANSKRIAAELERLLFDHNYRAHIQEGLSQVRAGLSQAETHALFADAKTAYERAAKLAYQLCT